MKFPKLHNQILIALIAGAVFGSLFNIDPNILILNYNNQDKVIKGWDEFIFITDSKDSVSFDNSSQLEIVAFFKKLHKSNSQVNIFVKRYRDENGELKSSYFPGIKFNL